MNGNDEQAPAAPTLLEVMTALAVLIDGALATECGAWSADMQASRDWARSVVDRARAAGDL